MSAWKRRANEVATRMAGQPVEVVHAALIEARELAKEEGVTYMGSDEELLRHARDISIGTRVRWR